MRIVGVIAEYNPFHSGHAHQLRQAREAAHADAVVAVMSGCFMQRGDAGDCFPRHPRKNGAAKRRGCRDSAARAVVCPRRGALRLRRRTSADRLGLRRALLRRGNGGSSPAAGGGGCARIPRFTRSDSAASVRRAALSAALSAAMAEVAPAARASFNPPTTRSACATCARFGDWARPPTCTRLPARRIITRLPLGMAFRPPRRFAPPFCAATGHPPIPPCRECGGLAGKSGAGKSPAPSGGAGHAAAGAASADG